MDIKGRRKIIQHCKVGSGYACKKRLSLTLALLVEVLEVSSIFFKNTNNEATALAPPCFHVLSGIFSSRFLKILSQGHLRSGHHGRLSDPMS